MSLAKPVQDVWGVAHKPAIIARGISTVQGAVARRPVKTRSALSLDLDTDAVGVTTLDLKGKKDLADSGSLRRQHNIDLIEPDEWTGTADDARLLTQRYTTALERIIRRDPEQYLWLHRRWKHQPKPRGRAHQPVGPAIS